MALSPQQIKLAQENLQDGDARIIKPYEGVSANLLGDAEFTRAWEEVSMDVVSICIEYLESIRFVDNPVANSETFPGRWRSAYIRRTVAGDVSTVAQVLRKGYAEQLDWNEARLGNENTFLSNDESVTGIANTTSDNPGRLLTVVIPNVSPYSVHAIVTQLVANTWPDVVIRGETYPGTWRVLGIVPRTLDDGSCEIQFSLAQPQYTLNLHESYGIAGFSGSVIFGSDVAYLFGVPRNLAQGIADAHKASGVGKSMRANASTDPSLIDLILYSVADTSMSQTGIIGDIDCEASSVMYLYWNVTNIDGPGLVIGTAPFTLSDGVSYSKRWRDNGNATFDVFITKRITNPRELDPYISEKNLFSEVQRSQFYGYTQDNAEIEQDAAVPVAGQVIRQRWDLRNDCSVDGSIEVDEADEIDDDISYSKNAFEEQELARTVHAVDELPEPTQVAGQIIEIDQRKDEYQRHQIETRTRNAIPDVLSGDDHAEDPFRTITRERTSNVANPPDGSLTPGEAVRASSQKNLFGWWDADVETITAKMGVTSSVEYDENVFETEEREAVTNVAAPLAAAEHQDGVLVQRASRKNDLDLYDTQEGVREAEPSVDAGVDYERDVFGEREVTRTRNDPSPAPLPAVVVGVVHSAQSQRNLFGWYDVEESEETATPNVDRGSDTVEDQFESVLVTKTRHAVEQEAQPAFAPGSITELRHEKDIFGYYEKTEEVRTATTGINDTHVRESNYEKIVTEEEWFNSSLLPDADHDEATDTTVIVNGRRNIFGLYDWNRLTDQQLPPFSGPRSWDVYDPRTFRVASLSTVQVDGVWHTRIGGYSVYRYKYAYTLQWFDNVDDALAFIDEGDEGSDFGQSGLLWWGKKVEVTAVSA